MGEQKEEEKGEEEEEEEGGEGEEEEVQFISFYIQFPDFLPCLADYLLSYSMYVHVCTYVCV